MRYKGKHNLEPGQSGEIQLIIDNTDDLWALYNIIAIGDNIRLSTFRKVHHETGSKTSSTNKRIFITINIEEIEPRNFTNYNHMHFCYKRGTKNYGDLLFNLLPAESYHNCQNETHRVCGFFDSLKNIICLPKNETCPMLTTFLISKDKAYIYNYQNKYDNNAEIININITNNNQLFVLKSHSALNIATTWKSDYDYDVKIYNNFRVDLSQPC